MVEHAGWDYWTYVWSKDRPGEYHDVRDTNLAQSDIRHGRFDLDTEKWCKRTKFFWTAREAALISFFRDPGKVEGTDEGLFDDDDACGPYSSEDDASEKAAELRQHIIDLCDMILHAQKDRVLPTPMLRGVYIEWAEHVGVDIPHPVLEALQDFERECNERERNDNGAEAAESDNDSTGEREASEKRNSHETKGDNSLRKVILALLTKANPNHMPDLKKLAWELDGILETLSTKRKDRRFQLKWKTIERELMAASDLYLLN
jgi:hypothetical protein